MNPDEPSMFPKLPIVTVDAPPPKRSEGERYGSFYYLGIAGFVIVVGLVSWFGWNVWSLRSVWTNVYTLHDEKSREDERILAAYTLSKDGRMNAQQRWDIALRKPLPPLARYLIAESLTTDFVKADPDLFAKVVARSEGWPEWLRLLGVRLMGLAASEGVSFPAESLGQLEQVDDPYLKDWLDYIRAVSGDGDRSASARLHARAAGGGAESALAGRLASAVEGGSLERANQLEAATRWLRHHAPESEKVWMGWEERDDHLIHEPR